MVRAKAKEPVVVAVASGKGGTGKTTLATNLAAALVAAGRRVQLLDADVEEPNVRLFIPTKPVNSRPVEVLVPVVDAQHCSLCGRCAEVCEYGAIIVMGTSVVVFNELCHSCGACALFCPRGAIDEVGRPIGQLSWSVADALEVLEGRLNVGEARATPVVRELRQAASADVDVVVVDAAPGASCPAIEAVRGAGLVVLVAEPTPFGLNDLKLAVEMVRALGQPFVVAVNRAGAGDNRVQRYCAEEGIEVVFEIADDRRIAEAYSRGRLAVDAVDGLRQRFLDFWKRVSQLVAAPPTRKATSSGASAQATRRS